jgi:chromatin remodeling complex protein RSC6
MVRQTKSKTAKTADTEQVTPLTSTVASTESVSTESVSTESVSTESVSKVKKTKTTKSVDKVETAEVVNEEVVVVPEDKVVSYNEITVLAEESAEFAAKLQQLAVVISSLKTDYRNLEKKWTRELKTAQKLNSKRKRKAGNRAPSGFVKPTCISDELAKFLDKPSGTEMARTDVTREVNKYIRAHNLQDENNGRKIHPDAKLATLLKLKKTDELTYFNLQKYMSHHFAKATKEVVATVAAV